MNQNRKFALTSKLSIAIVATGLLPAAIIGGLALRTASKSAEDVGKGYQQVAENVADKIERNLFERYGDVQAFGVNGCDRKWRSVLSDGEVNPVKIPEIVGTSHAQTEHSLGVCLPPPTPRQLETFLDHMSVATFDLT